VKCTACGAALDATIDRCPGCGAEVELGRLTGILGRVCRACDAYNDPGTGICCACGSPLGSPAEPEATSAAPPREVAPPGSPLVRSYSKGGGSAARAMPASPGAAPRATLVLERGAGVRGATWRLEPGVAPAGRGPGALSFPGDPTLAPHHATFVWRDGALRLCDQGSPGGTFVRLRRDAVAALVPGETFVVGDRVLRYAGPLPPSPPPSIDGTRRLGAPRPTPPAVVLEELLEGGAPGRVHVRGGPVVVIGRGGAAIALGDDPTVAATHAELRLEPDGSARLRDLGSATGTFVRLSARGEQALRDGDVVRIGREVLRVSLAEG
jgi:pSer/pThr/pTyr-binding forkhead associated (FHA) protein